ncbi:MAG: hypothetical protein HUU55_19980 [Myxococcales bacterium]|nr:hypothetical protein [Myxococcales bacterium]
MKHRRTHAFLIGLLAASFFVGACSDDGAAGGSVDPFADTEPNLGGVPTGPPTLAEGDVPLVDNDSTGTKPDRREQPPDPEIVTPDVQGIEIIFLHDISKPLDVQINEKLPILVKAIDYDSGGPAAGITLSFAIIDATGVGAPGDAELETEAAITDEEGLTNVIFRGNTVGDVLYTVEVTAEDAKPKTIQIRVGNPPTGDLRVTIVYEGAIPIEQIKIQLLEGNISCNVFNPVKPPQLSVAEKTVLSPESKPVFKSLTANKKYTVVASALKSPGGGLAAAGCQDAVYVEPDIENETTLKVFVLALNPAGLYDLNNVFDFTGAIPGQLGDILDELATLFYNPGKFLIDQIKKLVTQYVGGLITDVVFGLFEDKLAELITEWVLNDAPDWIQDFFTIGQDLLQVIAKLELTGQLKISKLMNDYYVQGQINFTGIVLSWKLGCDKNAPDYEQCGKYPFTLTDIDNKDFPLDLLTGNWTGAISNFDHLTIDPHKIALNYGKLILFVLNKVILKQLTGKDSLKDAVASMIGCEGIANALGNLGIDEQDIYDACVGTVSLLVVPLEGFLLGLETDSLVSLKGEATMHDDDSDLVVDRIEPGTWDGQILLEGAAGNPFSGTWEAFRINPAAP